MWYPHHCFGTLIIALQARIICLPFTSKAPDVLKSRMVSAHRSETCTSDVSAMPAPPARQKTTHASIEIGQQTNPMQCPNTYVEQIQITLHLEYDECDHQTQYHDNMMSI